MSINGKTVRKLKKGDKLSPEEIKALKESIQKQEQEVDSKEKPKEEVKDSGKENKSNETKESKTNKESNSKEEEKSTKEEPKQEVEDKNGDSDANKETEKKQEKPQLELTQSDIKALEEKVRRTQEQLDELKKEKKNSNIGEEPKEVATGKKYPKGVEGPM